MADRTVWAWVVPNSLDRGHKTDRPATIADCATGSSLTFLDCYLTRPRILRSSIVVAYVHNCLRA